MMKHSRAAIIACFLLPVSLCAVEPPEGFRNVPWGSGAEQVRTSAGTAQWRPLPADNAFPRELNVTRYLSTETVAGYPASVTFYFIDDQLFQATITFPFDNLINFDFNYNVFRSVDEYYRAIHDQTITFVKDIYELLRAKYGKKQPVFKGLDPLRIFDATNAYLKQERWNLRYNPSEYYKRIVTASYARWDFPKTRVIFAINISAADKRFDYRLSLTSLDLERTVKEKLDALRTQGL